MLSEISFLRTRYVPFASASHSCTHLLVREHQYGHILQLVLAQHGQQFRPRRGQSRCIRRVDDVDDGLGGGREDVERGE